MNKRGFLAALGLGSGTLFSLPAIAETAGSDRRSWQPDGLGYRARIGLLTSNDDAEVGILDDGAGRRFRPRWAVLVDTRTFSDCDADPRNKTLLFFAPSAPSSASLTLRH
jgi:hypothetical protein